MGYYNNDSNKESPAAGDNFKAVIDVAQAAVSPEVLPLLGVGAPALFIKQSKEIKFLEAFMPAPARKRGTATVHDAEGFAEFVNRQKSAGTVITGLPDLKNPHFCAVLNEHAPSLGRDLLDGGIPGWRDHRVCLEFRSTREWDRWRNKNEEVFTQDQFAEFLEDSADSVFVPEDKNTGAAEGVFWPSSRELLEVAMTLQAYKTVQFRGDTRLSDGQHQLTYIEEQSATAGAAKVMKVPEWFALNLQPFTGLGNYVFRVRLRYRIREGKLVFFYKIHRPELAIEDIWNSTRAKIETATGLKVVVGSLDTVAAIK